MNGGAWEVIIEKASLEVSKYLSSTTTPLVPESTTTAHILTLLEVGTLRDIVVERNLNRLCGMIGCAGTPLCQLGSVMPCAMARDDKSSDDGDAVSDLSEEDADDLDSAFRCYRRHTRRSAPRSHMPGAAHADRFCSADCAAAHESLAARVGGLRGPPELLAAVAGLFPNMSPSALRLLAAGEPGADIRERDSGGPVGSGDPEGSVGPMGSVGAGGPVSPVGSAVGVGPQSRCLRPAAPRRVALAAYDWFLTVATPDTRRRVARLWRHMSGAAGGDGGDSAYAQCVRPVAAALDGAALQPVDTEAEGPAVHPVLQQQREELVAAHVFAPETTAALSRLLLFDHVALEAAWEVWRSGGLLASLRFPFALPGAMFAGGPSKLFVALVMAAVSGLCSPEVWAEWTRPDNALTEVLSVLGASADDVTACIKVLALD